MVKCDDVCATITDDNRQSAEAQNSFAPTAAAREPSTATACMPRPAGDPARTGDRGPHNCKKHVPNARDTSTQKKV